VPTLEPSLFEFLFDTTRAVANLIIGGTLERHHRVRLILAHAGGTIPYVRDRIVDRGPIVERARRTPPPTPDELQQLLGDGLAASRRQLERMFYDLTLSANDTVLDCVDELAPSDQLLLGTDFPLAQEIGVRSTLAGLEGHNGLDEADRRKIEGDNAHRLFPRLAGAEGSQRAADGRAPHSGEENL
jgi:aminocarboxymuconate-semialdehyde decarboxylase